MSQTYVQVQPDGTGKKVQAFENTLDGTNPVEAQATVGVTALGLEKGTPDQAMVERNYQLEVLLTDILAELRKMNFYTTEINPRLISERAEFAKEDMSQFAGVTPI